MLHVTVISRNGRPHKVYIFLININSSRCSHIRPLKPRDLNYYKHKRHQCPHQAFCIYIFFIVARGPCASNFLHMTSCFDLTHCNNEFARKLGFAVQLTIAPHCLVTKVHKEILRPVRHPAAIAACHKVCRLAPSRCNQC